jgi:plasmid maintenance system antidote protein VapI
LTASAGYATIDNMSKPAPITDLLRRTIVESGIPYLKIEQATGIHRASISRFVTGERSLRLDVADKLAEYLGLELRPRKKGK